LKSNPVFPDYPSYIGRIAFFAMRWQGVNSLKYYMAIFENLMNLSKGMPLTVDEHNDANLKKVWIGTLGFFYLHGN